MTDTLACDALLRRITAGGSVTVKELQHALGDTHWRWFNAQCEFAAAQRQLAQEAREGLRDYIALVKQADMHSGRADKRSKVGNYPNLKVNIDSKYEKALERLSELLSQQPSLAIHLDRQFDWDEHGAVSADRDSVPRVIYNKRGVYGKVKHIEIATLAELKEVALTLALQEPQATEDVNELEPENTHARTNLNALQKLVRR